MAFDMFLKLTGIAGEFKNASHVDEVDISSLTWGLSGPPAAGGKPRSKTLWFKNKWTWLRRCSLITARRAR